MAAAHTIAHPLDRGEPEVSFTTSARVTGYAREAGLQSRQVMMLVARCALVKHLAEQYGDRFILKGGALLYHVYGTPRVSFLDTDYAETETRGAPDPIDVERSIVFTDRASGYSLQTTPDGQWTERGNMVRAQNLTFTIDGFEENWDARARVNISVSFRRSERLDPVNGDLFFDPDGLLTDNTAFKVSGLTLNEAAAEKILAWCLKEDLSKHFADLAILARDHPAAIDRGRVVQLVAEKFERERRVAETRGLYEGLTNPADLVPRFLDEGRLERLRGAWSDSIGTRIWLRRNEQGNARSIVDVANVEGLVREYWSEAVETLPG